MADPTIRVNILGDNSDLRRATRGASDDLGRFGKSAGKLSKTMKVVGIAGLGLGAATAAWVGKGATSLMRIERIGAQTDAVLKSTGGAANVTREEVDDLAGAIEAMSGVEAESTTEGQNLLLTFTNIRNEAGKGNDIFDQTTRIMADMAVAMGKKPKDSAIQLGKALNDPIKGVTALSRVGVTFTADQKKLIKSLVDSGKTMDAQKIILEELNTEFGGSAKAFGQTTRGKIDRFKHSLGTLQEAIANKVLPAFTELVDFAVDTVLPRMEELSSWFDEKKDLIADFGRKISEQWSNLSLPTLDFGDLVDFGKVDVAPVGTSLAADAKGWAGDILKGVQEGFDTGDWSSLGKSIGSGLANALESAGDLATTFFAWIGKQIKKVDWVGLGIEFGRQVPSLLVGLATGILTFDLGGLLSGLAKNWQAVLLGVLTLAFAPAKLIAGVSKILTKIPLVGPMLNWLFKGAVTLSKGAVSLAGKVIAGFGRGMLDGIRRFFPQFGTALGSGVSTLITNLRSRAAGFLMVAQGWGAAILRALAGLPGQLGQWAGKAVGMLLGALGRGLPGILSFFRTMPGKILAAVGALGGLLVAKGRDLLDGLWDGIVAAYEQVRTWMSLLPTKLVSAIGDVGSYLLQHGLDFIQGFINGMVERAKDIPGVVRDKVVGAAKGAVHFFGKFGSPSRLTMRYGRWFSEGFAIGIKSKTKDVVAAAEKMVEKVKQKIADARSFAREIRAAFVEFGNVTSFETPESGGSFQTLLAEARRRADQAKAFASGFAKLRKMGLNETTLRQIREAGVEGGLPVMEQIINQGGAAGIRDLNALTRQIGASGALLGNREATRKYGFDPTKTEVVITVDGKSDELVRALAKSLRADVRKKGAKAVLGIAV